MDISTIFKGIQSGSRRWKFSTEQVLKYLKVALIFAVSIVLLLLARDAINLWFGGSGQTDGDNKKAVTRPQQIKRKSLNAYAQVVEQNVFGVDGAKFKPLAGAGDASGTAAVPSQLEFLKLAGAVAWSNGFGYAFVTGRTGEQEVYKTGEDIEGAGKLVKVNPKSMVINASGSDVEIFLQEVGEVPSAASTRPRSTPSSQRSNGRVSSDFAMQTSDTSYVVDQKAVEESIDNPENIMTDARLIPNMIEGKQEGFVIREVKNPGIYHSLGLQNNDILVSVNEFELSNPQAALQAFSALKGMDYIELNIIRGGNPMTLTYSLR